MRIWHRLFAVSMVGLLFGCSNQVAEHFQPIDYPRLLGANGAQRLNVLNIALVSADSIEAEEIRLFLVGYRLLGVSDYTDESNSDELEDAVEQAKKVGADTLLIAKRPLPIVNAPMTITYPDVCRSSMRECVEQRTLFGRRLASNGVTAAERIENYTQPVQHILRFYGKDDGV